MTRTTIEIDDELVATAMRLYSLRTKRDAVDLALRMLVGEPARVYDQAPPRRSDWDDEPMTVEEALAMQGSGWDGNLDKLHSKVAST